MASIARPSLRAGLIAVVVVSLAVPVGSLLSGIAPPATVNPAGGISGVSPLAAPPGIAPPGSPFHGGAGVVRDGSSTPSGPAGTVVGALNLGTGVLAPSLDQPPGAREPDAFAVCSLTNSSATVYVANFGFDSVSVLAGTNKYVLNGTILTPVSSFNTVATIDVGEGPAGLACDQNYLYVADEESNELTVVNRSTGAVVDTLAVGLIPDAVAVDWVTGQVLVANLLSDELTVVDIDAGDISLSHVAGTVPVGSSPVAVTVTQPASPYAPYVLVANEASANVTVLNATTLKVYTNVHTGLGPTAVTSGFYQSNHHANYIAFVANRGSGTVSALNLTSLSVTSFPAGWGPDAILPPTGYPSDDDMVVADSWDGYVDFGTVGFYCPGVFALDPGSTLAPGQDLVGDCGDSDPVALAGVWSTVFIANFEAGSVNVVNTVGIAGFPWTNESGPVPITASIGLGLILGTLLQLLESPSPGMLLATQALSDRVVAVNLSGGPLGGSIAVGRDPVAAAFDAADNAFYIVNQGSNNLTVISGATGGVSGSIPVGLVPDAIAFDASNDYLYVANAGSGNVTVVNGSTAFSGGGGGSPSAFDLGSIPVGADPDAVVVDSQNGLVYVANAYSDNVSVLNGSTTFAAGGSGNALDLGSIPVGAGPDALALDSAVGALYVANEYSDNVSVVNATFTFSSPGNGSAAVLGSVPVGLGPDAIALDPQNGFVYVANGLSDNLTVLGITAASGPVGPPVAEIPVGVHPGGILYDPRRGELLVSDSPAGILQLVAPTYALHINETGLPPGTSWSVDINGQTQATTNATLEVALPVGNFSYTIPVVPATLLEDYYATPNAGGWYFNGTSAFSVVFTLRPGTGVSFRELGLPTGTPWSVDVPNEQLLSGSGGKVEVGESTGSLDFAIPNVTEDGVTYGVAKVSSVCTGCESLSPLPGLCPGCGGDSPLAMAATISRTTTLTITFGAFRTVYFNESDIPKFEAYRDASWGVGLLPSTEAGSVAPLSASTFGPSVAFELPAGGTYRYWVFTPGTEYKAAPVSGTLHVGTGSAPISKTLKFDLVRRAVKFQESGLDRHVNWTVTLTNGTSLAVILPDAQTKTAGGTVVFQLPYGTYEFTVSAANGQLATPATGILTVTATGILYNGATSDVIAFGPG